MNEIFEDGSILYILVGVIGFIAIINGGLDFGIIIWWFGFMFLLIFFPTPIQKIVDSVITEISSNKRRHKIEEEEQKKAVFESEQIAKGFVKIKNGEGKNIWLSKDEANEQFLEVLKSINEFRHSKNYSSEEGYHAELYGWLKARFKNAKTEERIGSSKPDISIGNVAIEVKGPTDDNAINTLPAKCLKYLKHYDYLIFVLFNPHFSENNFREIAEGIEKYHPGVIIIRKEN